jgi:hypothetical protein
MMVYVRVADLSKFEELADELDTSIDVHLLANDAPLVPQAYNALVIAIEDRELLPLSLRSLRDAGYIDTRVFSEEEIAQLRRQYGC